MNNNRYISSPNSPKHQQKQENKSDEQSPPFPKHISQVGINPLTKQKQNQAIEPVFKSSDNNQQSYNFEIQADDLIKTTKLNPKIQPVYKKDKPFGTVQIYPQPPQDKIDPNETTKILIKAYEKPEEYDQSKNNNANFINNIQNKQIKKKSKKNSQSNQLFIKRTQEYINKYFSYQEYFEMPRKQRQEDAQGIIFQKIVNFRDFCSLINLSNNFFIQVPEQPIIFYKAYVGKGNNGILVRNQLSKTRWWWQVVDEKQNDQDDINFVWTSIRKKQYSQIQLQQIQQINLELWDNSVQEDTPVSSKQQSRKMDSQIPVKQISELQLDQFLNQNDSKILQKRLKQKKMSQSSPYISENFEEHLGSIKKIKWSSQVSICNNPTKIKLHNHLTQNFHLGNKKALFYNLRNYYNIIGIDPFKNMPLTFHILDGQNDQEFKIFLQFYQDFHNSRENKNIWIIKPGETTNRGNGIELTDNINDILRIFDKGPSGRTFIIQKYIEKPLLYKSRKFDFRCYICITNMNQIIKGYWYNEGYVRTSSKEYNLKKFDKTVHLTNDCVQRKGESYGKFENGNKVSFQDFQKYIQQVYNIDFYQQIYPELKRVATDAIKSIFHKIELQKQTFNFELFGLDFMVDDQNCVQLIEANTNPDLDASSPTLARLIPQLIDNLLKLTVDPLFPPPNFPKNKKQYISDSNYENQKFELVFDEKYQSEELKASLIQMEYKQEFSQQKCIDLDEEEDIDID